MGANDLRRILSSRHRLHGVPEQCRRRDALDGIVRPQQHDAGLSHGHRHRQRHQGLDSLQLHHPEQPRVLVHERLQEVPPDVRRIPNFGLRAGHGLVLLDLADRVRAAVEL